MYIYQADTYCDSCGEEIRRELTRQGLAPEDPSDEYSYDSDNFPKGPCPEEATDSPDHCGRQEWCIEGVDLREYGIEPHHRLLGAESYKIGALLSDGLTEYGVEYLKEMMEEKDPTPYQRALYNFWRQAFSDYL